METLSFKVCPSDASVPLAISLWINDQRVVGPVLITEETMISHDVNDDDDLTYDVKVELSGKKDEHCVINEQGEIVKDSLVIFKECEIMGIDIGHFLNTRAVYRHNHNGHSDPVEQNFAFSMGCNGTLEFSFTTPIYMWLLENM